MLLGGSSYAGQGVVRVRPVDLKGLVMLYGIIRKQGTIC